MPVAPTAAATSGLESPTAVPAVGQVRPSILFPVGGRVPSLSARVSPEALADLNLDQVVEGICARRSGDQLQALYESPLPDVASVRHRLAVFRDLEQSDLLDAMRRFSTVMEAVRARTAAADTSSHDYWWHRQRWFLEAMTVYCDAISSLADALDGAALDSAGLIEVREYLRAYAASKSFQAMTARTRSVLEGLSGVTFNMRLFGGKVTVGPATGQFDYSDHVRQLFDRFRQQGLEDSRNGSTARDRGLNHVEAHVVDLVSRLWPEAFAALAEHCARYEDFWDPAVAQFALELQFFLAYLDYIGPLQRDGLPFCHPQVQSDGPLSEADGAFDLALAHQLHHQVSPVVGNDFRLAGPERILVVTGPNQGGKTTFARMVGQLHHLAAVGVPVPGRTATLPLVDRVLTHFEQVENLDDARGKLEDDLRRLHHVLQEASPRSVVIMNEVLTSTSLSDAREMGRRLIGQLSQLGVVSVYVTFVDELASLGPSTVSMVSQVDPEDPARRTFKLLRQPANGVAFAAALASRYGLTQAQLEMRIAP